MNNNPFMPPANAFGMARPPMPGGPGGPGPGGLMQPAIPGSPQTTMGQYTPPTAPPVQTIPIQPGDTLSALAKRYGTTVSTLQYMNGIKDPDTIIAGNSLIVPNRQHSAIPQAQALVQTMNPPQNPNLRPPQQPQIPSPQQQAIQPVAPEAMAMSPLKMAAGAGAMGAALPGMLGGLAKMMPKPMQAAGRIPSPPGFGNVAPMVNNVPMMQGQARAMMKGLAPADMKNTAAAMRRARMTNGGPGLGEASSITKNPLRQENTDNEMFNHMYRMLMKNK